MSATEQPEGSSVLKQPGSRLGSRRLPLGQPAEVAGAPVLQPSSDLANLRARFSDELAVLAQEVRDQALREARATAEAELTAARVKLQAELETQQEAQLQERERALEERRLQFAQLSARLEEERQRLAESMEPVVGRLAIAVVLRLLGRHVAEHALVADLARHAVDSYRLNPLRIRIAEADHRRLLRELGDPTLMSLFQVDHDASVGACVIDYGTGQLDAGLETQLAELKSALFKAGQEENSCVAAL